MIFATVGSHPTFRFDRLLSALDAVPGGELVVQHGPGRPPSQAREAIPFMSFEEIVEHMGRASAVVSHAGVGSILCSLEAGRVPVVMPREARYGETVDDHQVELARALSPKGCIILAETAAELPAKVAQAASRESAPIGDAVQLVSAVRDGLRTT